jgi:glyoxylase-like metal-dependent hydrolase (beta-lactamase superfamily II)
VELYSGVHQIASLFGGRNLYQYLFVGRNSVLADTGIGSTPEKVIFPFLDRLNLNPRNITFAITTHADLDHQGGNSAIKKASPATLLACGEADRQLAEHPQSLYDHRYNHLKREYGVGLDAKGSPDAGEPCKMDLTFEGGEKIRLREDWTLDVLHLPGHSHGHLALYDPQHRAAFTGDAVQGSGCPKATGGIAIPVTYYYVDTYLATIRHLEGLELDALYTGHWPAMRGEEIKDFFSDSRRTVEFFDRVILSSLKKAPGGLALKQLVEACAEAAGDWPSDGQILAMFPIKGHMDRLEQHGKVSRVRDTRPVRWVLREA